MIVSRIFLGKFTSKLECFRVSMKTCQVLSSFVTTDELFKRHLIMQRHTKQSRATNTQIHRVFCFTLFIKRHREFPRLFFRMKILIFPVDKVCSLLSFSCELITLFCLSPQPLRPLIFLHKLLLSLTGKKKK